jgi:hypothetical protein
MQQQHVILLKQFMLNIQQQAWRSIHPHAPLWLRLQHAAHRWLTHAIAQLMIVQLFANTLSAPVPPAMPLDRL